MDARSFDVDALTEEELLALNRAVVERLRALGEARVAAEMRAFEPGDLVAFEHRGEDGHRTVHGLVIKTNRKTVSLLDEDRVRWNVSPGLLEHVLPGPPAASAPGAARRLPRPPKKRKRR